MNINKVSESEDRRQKVRYSDACARSYKLEKHESEAITIFYLLTLLNGTRTIRLSGTTTRHRCPLNRTIKPRSKNSVACEASVIALVDTQVGYLSLTLIRCTIIHSTSSIYVTSKYGWRILKLAYKPRTRPTQLVKQAPHVPCYLNDML